MKPQIIISILFFLLAITVLGIVLYVYLRREQDKVIPKDKYDEIAQSSNINITETKKYNLQNTFFAYLRLTGMSVISGLLIASIILIMYFFSDWNLAGVFVWLILQTVQYSLVVPATFAVYTFDSLMYSKTHPVLRVGIPLIINIIGANSTFIPAFIMDVKNDVSSFYIYNNVEFSIENEALIPWSVPNPNMHYIAYQVTLHVKNDLQKETPASFILAHYNDSTSSVAGVDEHTWFMSQGESDIIVNMPILIHDLQCDGKPLYLFYYIDYEHSKSIAMVNDNINQQLQQIACNFSP